MDKRSLTERDICTKFILPAVKRAGWDEMVQVREEVYFTKGRIIVRGKLVTRGKAKKADFVLYYKPNIPIALIEAKDNKHSVGDGMQQALDYAETLKIPFVFSSNGDGFVFHDRTGASTPRESNLGLDAFPSPADLWARFRAWKGLDTKAEEIVLQDYHDDGSGKEPRYYQVNAVNAAIEAIAKGQDRVLLVMATGTGKTYTAFQIIWRLWKSQRWNPEGNKRILFLADRNVLIDYWNAVHAVLNEVSGPVSGNRKAQPQSWMNYSIGRTDFALGAAMNSFKQWVRAELYVSGTHAEAHFHLLHDQKDAIEEELGYALQWEHLPSRRDCRIAVYREKTDCQDQNYWLRQHKWLAAKLNDMHRIFVERVRALDADDWQPDTGTLPSEIV